MAGRGRALVIRADAGARMGTGHVMRCLALAQAWRDGGGEALFVTAASTPGIDTRLQAEGMEVLRLAVRPGSREDALQTTAVARARDAACLVVDGYQFGGDYQRAVCRAEARLLVVDDHGHAEHYWADLVLNQNLHADETLYRHRRPSTRLLLGTRYVLLRREFWKWRTDQREIPPVARRLLVTMGGSDPDNVTLNVLQALEPLDIEGFRITVIAGSGNPHYQRLRTFTARSRIPVHLERRVTDMPRWITWADAAITAAGGTTWELAYGGVPSLTLILADNQARSARRLMERGIFPTLGRATDVEGGALRDATRRLLLSAPHRKKQRDRAAALVDGMGVFRVAEILQEREG